MLARWWTRSAQHSNLIVRCVLLYCSTRALAARSACFVAGLSMHPCCGRAALVFRMNLNVRVSWQQTITVSSNAVPGAPASQHPTGVAACAAG